MNDIVVIEKQNALAVFTTPEMLDPILAKIRAEIDGFTPDVSTVTSRKAIASLAYKVAQSKTYLDGVGKELADAQKEIPKKIDASRKRVRDTLDEWKNEVRRPLTEWEIAEQARIDGHKSSIEIMQGAGEYAAGAWMETDVVTLRSMLDSVERTAMGAHWQEFAGEAAAAKDAALNQIREAIAKREKHDAEQAELARLRAEAEARAEQERIEKAARDQQERDARIAAEAAERARIEAEQAAQAERDRAEQARLIAEREAQEKQAEAERDRQAAIAAQEAAEQRAREAEANAKREAEEAVERERERVEAKRVADAAEAKAREERKGHKAKVNNKALAAFVSGGLDQDAAKLAVTLIAACQIPGVSISY